MIQQDSKTQLETALISRFCDWCVKIRGVQCCFVRPRDPTNQLDAPDGVRAEPSFDRP
jgi:hypothetical protein